MSRTMFCSVHCERTFPCMIADVVGSAVALMPDGSLFYTERGIQTIYGTIVGKQAVSSMQCHSLFASNVSIH